MLRVGIDLGGTKIEAIALAADGRELKRLRRPTPTGDYRATLALIFALVNEIEVGLGEQASIGIGTPGSLSPSSGLIRNANSVCLNGKPLDKDLETLLQRPIRLANDADCFSLSEATDGAAASARSVFGVILGTGTGGGIVIDGRLLTGPNAVAGEWGHNPLPWPTAEELPGPDCYCGKRGCIETFLSGPGLAADFQRHSGRLQSAAEITQLAEQGDNDAGQCLARYFDRLARGLASVINLIDPEVIVLGGGLSRHQPLYEEIPKRWQKYVFSDTVRTRLLPPRHGDSSGVRGAAWLWPVQR